jgi:chromosome segregation ATPase
MEMNTNQMNPQDEQRYIKDMQRGAKDMDRGLKQLENMIKQSAKKGITISPEMQTNTEKMRLMIDSVKNAKTATELQNVDMGEISQMMMELDNSRRDLENNTRRLDDTKRNIKDAERGITQFERQLKKAGSCVSEEIKEKLAALKASISTIKNAKTWAEVEAAGLEDMGDLFMSLDENRQVLEVCGRWPQMSKEMDKQLKSLNNQLKSAKTITTRLSKRNIDISSQFASFEAAVQKMQTVRDEVKELMTSGDAEGAMNLLEENFFGQMDDVMQYSRVIQMMSGVGQFTTEFKKGITQAKTQINKLKKSRIDVTELNEILAEAQSKGNEILAIMKAGNFDADEVISMIEDLEQNRLNFEDKIADLTGTEREIMPWESGNQIFNRVEMPTFLNAYMRPQESQTMPMMQGPMGPNTGSANPIGESNPQPSPGPTNTLAPGTY